MRVNVSVSDPWEIGEAIAWRPMPGELVKFEAIEGREIALIRLDEPISYSGQSWSYLIASPRHYPPRLNGLNEGKKVAVSITGITAQQATSDAPFPTSAGRGALACIGDLERG